MTMKSLLLGAAAGIAVIGAAQAADLPMTKGEAVEYVKVCSAFGPGFFYIPGSDTCLQIKGEVRADYRVFGQSGDKNDFTRDNNRSAFQSQGRIAFDARTQTDLGLLRSYFQINATAHAYSKSGIGATNNFEVDKAFIQFGGLTAGYAHSFFGFYDNDYGDTIFAPYYSGSPHSANLLAYTYDFGGGFQATLSLEDNRDHRSESNIMSGFSYQGGQQFPDVVGQLRYDADWGALALQGAVHQNRTGEFGLYTAPPVAPATTGVTYVTNLPSDDKWGYAVGATALFKIPAIDGGHFVVEGQYAKGALDYLGVGNTLSGGQDIYYKSVVATAAVPPVVTYGGLNSGKGWSIVAEFGGNITPVLNANLVGSYIDTSYDRLAGPKFGLQEYTIAANLTYTIVKGLTIGAEVSYTHEKTKNVQTSAATEEAAATYDDLKQNVWAAGVRLKRTF